MKRSDGVVVPSVLSVRPPNNAASYYKNNVSLKEGVVLTIIYPEDPLNMSKNEIEYNVVAVDYDAHGIANLVTYPNCRMVDVFGASNNYLRYTVQPSTTKLSDLANPSNGNPPFNDGSRVLLLCVSGQSSAGSAVIVGGVQQRNAPISSASDGQFYNFNFNGIQQLINTFGELTFTFNSPTDQTGKQTNAAAAGTQLKIDKNGHFIISDNLGQTITIDRDAKTITIGNGSESIVVDKGAKSITLTSGADETLNAGGKLNATSGADMSLSSGAAMNVKSSGAMNVQSGGAMQTQASGQWQLQAQGNVMITALGEVTIMGAAGPVIASQGPLVMMGLGDVPVATVGTSICQGIGNLGLPVISQIITGSFTCFVGT